MLAAASENFFDLLGVQAERCLPLQVSSTPRPVQPLVHEPEDIELIGECEGGRYVYFAGEALRLFLLRVLEHEGSVALDIETGGLLPQTSSIFLVSMSCRPGEVGVFDFRDVPMDLFRQVLREKGFVIHNACFELPFLAHHVGVMPRCDFDTMVARQLLTAGDRKKGASLAECLRDYFGVQVSKKVRSLFPRLLPHSPLTNEEIAYSAGDVALLLPLAQRLEEDLLSAGILDVYWELEHPMIPIIAEHTLHGVTVDLEHLRALEARYSEAVENCIAEIDAVAPGLVWTSNPGLLRYLKDVYGLELENVDREALEGALRTVAGPKIEKLLVESKEDPEALKKLRRLEEKHPVVRLIRLILDARQNLKMLSTYIRPLLHEGPHQLAGIVEPAYKGGILNPVTKRVHPSFRSLGTETGRFSCSDPNLQNIPQEQEFRSIFTCDEGEVVITSDYSQFEVRYLAEIAGEERMIEMFQRGYDAYVEVEDLCREFGISRDSDGRVNGDDPKLQELSDDDRKRLLDANQRLVDADFHTLTAKAVFGEEFEKADSEKRKKLRSSAKAVTFGIAYGAGPQLIANRTGISVDEAKRLIRRYYEANPAVKAFMDTCHNAVLRRGDFGIHGPGYTRSLSGRKRFYPVPKQGEMDFEEREALIAGYQRAAQNHPIQAGNADVTKLATILLKGYLDKLAYNARIILWVHDEIVVVCCEEDADAVAGLVKDAMIGAAKRYLKRVPVTVSQKIDKRWAK